MKVKKTLLRPIVFSSLKQAPCTSAHGLRKFAAGLIGWLANFSPAPLVLSTRTQVMGFLPGIGTSEMLIVGVIALLLFGKNLPGVARNLGKSMAELKKGLSGFQEEFRNATREAERSVAYSPPAPVSRIPAPDPPARTAAPAAAQSGSTDDFTAPRFELD